MLPLKTGTRKNQRESLVPAFPGRNITYTTLSLCSYQAFTTAQQVLHEQFHRRRLCQPQHGGECPTFVCVSLECHHTSLSFTFLFTQVGGQKYEPRRVTVASHGRRLPGGWLCREGCWPCSVSSHLYFSLPSEEALCLILHHPVVFLSLEKHMKITLISYLQRSFVFASTLFWT